MPQRRLAERAQERHGRLRQAIEEGSQRVPEGVLGARADETLINLIRYTTRGGREEEPKEGGVP